MALAKETSKNSSVILSLSKDQFRLPSFAEEELILRQAQDDGLLILAVAGDSA